MRGKVETSFSGEKTAIKNPKNNYNEKHSVQKQDVFLIFR